MSTEQNSPSNKYGEELASRFTVTFGSLKDDALVTRFRAIIGTENLPDTVDGRLALSALKKLRTADKIGPSPAEFAALEYMIRAMRPAPLIRNGIPQDDATPDIYNAFKQWNNFCKEFRPYAASVGCIFQQKELGDKLQAEGTGFLLAPQVLMTNTHVLDAISTATRQLEPGQAVVNFGCEYGGGRTRHYDIASVIAVHEEVDACLLQLSEKMQGPWLKVSAEVPPALTEVAAIGFPYPDRQRNPMFIDPLFGNIYGVKRASPGLVTGYHPRLNTLYHDCSTLGGNSGSPVVRMRDCCIVGLHTGGAFTWKNTAVRARDLADWAEGHLS